MSRPTWNSYTNHRSCYRPSVALITLYRSVSITFMVCIQRYTPPLPVDCIPPSVARPSDYRLWHDSSYWKWSNGEYVGCYNGDWQTSIPPDGQDVRIEAGSVLYAYLWYVLFNQKVFLGMWMVVKEELPQMNKLWIEGVLEIDWTNPDLNVTLSATHIIILVSFFSPKCWLSGNICVNFIYKDDQSRKFQNKILPKLSHAHSWTGSRMHYNYMDCR